MSETADYSDLSIRRLELHGVGPFRDLVLDFPRKRAEDKDKAEVHIFVGENGTGKTTLLEAMTCWDRWHGLKFVGGKKEKRDWLIEKKMWPSDKEAGFSLRMNSNVVEKMEGQFRNDLDVFFDRYYSADIDPKIHQYTFFLYGAQRLLRPAVVLPGQNDYDLSLIFDALDWEKSESDKPLLQWVMNLRTKAAFARARGKNQEGDQHNSKVNRIDKAISEIIGREISFVIDEDRLRVALSFAGILNPIEGLPMGYQSLLGWLPDMIYRLSQFPAGLNSRFTLFLDEIDIHLHPKAQRKILPVIQKLFPNAQIFITTHSPFVVGSVDGAWVYKFKLDAEGYSVLDGEPRLSEDADSYRTILEEVFDIHEQFGIEAQSKLDEFYKLRQEVLANGSDEKWLQFNELGRDLAGQSAEMHSYVSLELRQAARVLNRQLIA